MELNTIILNLTYTLISLLIIIMLFWRFWFLRDPKRIPPKDKNLIISPADGKINEIIVSDIPKKEIRKGRFGKIDTLASDVSKEKYKLISIVMTPLDVHIQRAPIAGRVLYSRHTKGKFKNAIRDKIAIENEKNEILIHNEDLKIKVKVIQIAGALARRIISYVRNGQNIKKGERIGLINLGSQVSIIMPENIEIKVKIGERVRVGETILGKIN